MNSVSRFQLCLPLPNSWLIYKSTSMGTEINNHLGGTDLVNPDTTGGEGKKKHSIDKVSFSCAVIMCFTIHYCKSIFSKSAKFFVEYLKKLQ